jgi:hypothetical protein
MAPAVLRGEEREAPARGEARSEAAAGRTARVTERKKTIVRIVRSREDMRRRKEDCRRGDVRPVINKKEEGSYFRAHITSGSPIVEKVYAQYAILRPNFGLDCFSMPCLRLPKFGIWNQLIPLML